MAFGLLVCALVVLAGWWFVGRQVWTDDATIWRSVEDRELREVLWTRPQPLGDEFNTDQQEYEPSVAPDGTELFFVRGKPAHKADVYLSRRRDNVWTTPEPLASINTDGDELGPRLTPDGRFLLFYSDRASGLGQYDIWAAPRSPGGSDFGEPFNLGPSVNSESNEYGPAPTTDGTGLLFATNRKSARSEQREPRPATIRQTDSGDYDIFLATLDGAAAPAGLPPAVPPARGAGRGGRPVARGAAMQPSTEAATQPGSRLPLQPGEGDVGSQAHAPAADISSTRPPTEPRGPEVSAPKLAYHPARELPGVNTPHHEGAGCVSPAGDFLYFASDRPGGHGKLDLYRGRMRSGVVSDVENLGPVLNTPQNESDPQLAVGGFRLMFSSDGAGSRGGYDLLTAESREVYARRDARPLPMVGRSGWLLLLGMAALLPLLLFLRGWNDHRLDLLRKCLLVSVLFHVILTVVFSLYNVSRDIVQYVKRQQEMELAVDLRAADAASTIAAEIRDQRRLDLPVQAPRPVGVAQTPTDIPLETLEPLDAAELTVPQAQVDPGRMVVEVPVPEAAPPRPGEMLEVATPEPAAPLPDIDVAPAQEPVRVPEAQPPAASPLPQPAEIARRSVAALEGSAPEAVRVDVRPSEIDVGSFAEASELPRPQAAAAEMAAAVPLPPPAQPELGNPVPSGPPVTDVEAALPTPGEADAASATENAENTLMLSARARVPTEIDGPADVAIERAGDPVAGQPPRPTDALTSAELMPRADVTAVDVSIGPDLAVTLPELTAPEAMFQRSPEMRKPLVEKMGGTKQSEDAVDRALAYLARQQEPDGRWTRVDDEGPPGQRGKGPHDMACTGLSVLAFLAADHTPAKAGPYSAVVDNGLNFLLATQGPDGDLRGHPERRGGGSGAANLYDHGIACLALGEAGIMTGDKRYVDAAMRGAAFIVASQHPETGGWRYVPGEAGDTSVFGWQIMALHSAEQLGFEMPAAAREGALRYVEIASSGPRKMLGGYTPGADPTPAMTAELLFARILLGHTFDDADVTEACDYLGQHPPERGGDLYGWYYASLSLIQMENDAWRDWNERCRQTLVTTQRLRGPLDGSWDTNLKWGDQGGRIYTTALSTLTLEVYYRYLPMMQKK